MDDTKEAGRAVIELCTQLGIERVKDPNNLWESGHLRKEAYWNGAPQKVCRTCVIGAIDLAHAYGVISKLEADRLAEGAVCLVEQSGDKVSVLRTIPDMPAVYQVIREAAGI